MNFLKIKYSKVLFCSLTFFLFLTLLWFFSLFLWNNFFLLILFTLITFTGLAWCILCFCWSKCKSLVIWAAINILSFDIQFLNLFLLCSYIDLIKWIESFYRILNFLKVIKFGLTWNFPNQSVSNLLSLNFLFYFLLAHFLKELSCSWNWIPPVYILISEVKSYLFICIIK